jgi:hypothetical protein
MCSLIPKSESNFLRQGRFSIIIYYCGPLDSKTKVTNCYTEILQRKKLTP